MRLYNYLLLFMFFFTQSLNADEILNLGKEIFLEKGNCAQCHALSDAGSNGDIGPNLNLIKPSLETVIMAVTNGIGVMPAYDGILSSSEIKAVAKYVSEKSNSLIYFIISSNLKVAIFFTCFFASRNSSSSEFLILSLK